LLYHIQQFHFWLGFYSKQVPSILPNFRFDLQEHIPFSITVIILLCLLPCVSKIAFLLILSKSEKIAKYSVTLLIRCPISVVSNNVDFTNILSGNFPSQKIRKSEREGALFENLVYNLPDSVITMNQNGIITYSNKSTERIRGISPEDIVN
jgi:PAS domain-containing protein